MELDAIVSSQYCGFDAKRNNESHLWAGAFGRARDEHFPPKYCVPTNRHKNAKCRQCPGADRVARDLRYVLDGTIP